MGRRRKSRSIKPKLERVGERLRDPGPDEGGRYSPSPLMLQHGHVVEVAPKELRSTPDSSFPKRIATQRMIDRYRVQGIITMAQWKAANRLWTIWRATGLDPKMCANYSPDIVSGGGSTDGRMIGRSDGVAEYVNAMGKVSRVAIPCLVHVVIIDGSASDWARIKGHSIRLSAGIGVAFLRAALDELVAHFGY